MLKDFRNILAMASTVVILLYAGAVAFSDNQPSNKTLFVWILLMFARVTVIELKTKP
jgi:hypothetical protein